MRPVSAESIESSFFPLALAVLVVAVVAFVAVAFSLSIGGARACGAFCLAERGRKGRTQKERAFVNFCATANNQHQSKGNRGCRKKVE